MCISIRSGDWRAYQSQLISSSKFLAFSDRRIGLENEYGESAPVESRSQCICRFVGMTNTDDNVALRVVLFVSRLRQRGRVLGLPGLGGLKPLSCSLKAVGKLDKVGDLLEETFSN